jgi:hypothetical protein
MRAFKRKLITENSIYVVASSQVGRFVVNLDIMKTMRQFFYDVRHLML